MNLLLFIITLVIAFLAVRIGAIAFQLTGLEKSLAQFQSLSCFSGTGFTTKEAELITGNPQRRKVASALIILGNAGFVTLIATFANTLRPNIVLPQFKIPFLHLVFPSWLLPWANLVIVTTSIYVLYKLFTHSKVTKKITDALKRKIIKKELIKPVTFEELLVSTSGYGVSSVEVKKDSPVLNKTLFKSDLKKHDISVLVIERGKEAIPNPPATTKILLDDKLVCFGRLENIRRELSLSA